MAGLRLRALAILTAVSISLSAPVFLRIGETGKVLTLSDDSKSITIDGRTISLEDGSQSCQAGRGGQGQGQGARKNQPAKALYFISNGQQNEVVALKVAADGTLSDGSRTSTKGSGAAGVDADGKPAVPDALFSQGAVKVAGRMLVAVNAGSNTLSMFNIDAQDPTKLTMVGEPVDTLGEFPVSVGLSSKLKMACVANSGARAGIACFSMDATKGLTALDQALRPIDLGQKTPPVGPTNTISQTFFNSDSTALFTTVKGDPAVANKTGFLSSFPVQNSLVSTQETRSSPDGTLVLFGTALIPGTSNIFVTDASFGSATLAISNSSTASVTSSTKIADQKATCWAAFSDFTKTAFVTDVAVNHLVEVDTTTGDIVKTLKSTNGNPGMIDLVAAGKFVYALSPGNDNVKSAVTVFDISGGKNSAKEIQNFNPAGGITSSAMGMTFSR